MTLYQFNTLPYDRQLVAVFDTGTFLVMRWEEEDAVNLYHLDGGVFVELHYDTHRNEITNLRAFTSAAQLEDYTPFVVLPDDLTGKGNL